MYDEQWCSVLAGGRLDDHFVVVVVLEGRRIIVVSIQIQVHQILTKAEGGTCLGAGTVCL
jgi:hypothetical protein